MSNILQWQWIVIILVFAGYFIRETEKVSQCATSAGSVVIKWHF